MKLKIPSASSVFKNRKEPKAPSLEVIVLNWLNADVYPRIMAAEPDIDKKTFKVTGRVSVEVPYAYNDHRKEFMLLVKSHLVPIGYDVDFTWDGAGMGNDLCIITWTHTK